MSAPGATTTSGTITDSAPFIGTAIARGVAFLGRVQLPNGELPTMRWLRDDSQRAFVETTVFGTALIVGAIADVRGTDVIVTRAARFIEAEMLRFGVWKYSRVMGGGFAPDLDDTAMATHALQCARRPAPATRHVFLANRRRDGLFYTWISPRPRWLLDPRMWPIAAARWRHPFVHYRTFNAIAAEDDVDAVVNANVLFHLGRHGDGPVREAGSASRAPPDLRDVSCARRAVCPTLSPSRTNGA